MRVYTVHEPRKLTGDPARDAERFAFVRDGFHFWAFVLAPLWMLWRRLWLVFVLYVVVIAALEFGLWWIGAPPAAQFAVGALVSLLVGFEAGTLQRWSLTRRKWSNLSVVVGRNRADAERRFFDAWVPRGEAPQPINPPAGVPAPALRTPVPSTEVIGLFPEPERR